MAYMQWVNSTLGRLRHLIRPSDLEALLLTRRYWALASAPPGYTGSPTAGSALLDIEVNER
jgi:hypothetical protein